ncbi:MAG: hypothetical protein JXB32_04870 [Deltaproteobacteria bacterium]|nr:hypothetical protein [Deltaproteobacteria bacterium]
MKYRNLILVVAAAGLLGLGGAALSCNLADAVTCGDEELNVATGVVGDFGDDENARKVEAFFRAVVAVQAKATDLANELVTACKNIGTSVGLTDAELSPAGGASDDAARVTAACGTTLQTRISETIRAAIPSGAFLSLTYEPPVCEGSFDAYASCAAGCDVTVTPGELVATCEPGTISIGRCEASCSGECWVEASASCTGSCSATCTGSCGGACYGTCDGSAVEGTTCAGECVGECSGTCTGECSGTCVAEVSGACTGECHGGCDVWIEPPRCEVYARPPEVDADCHASCQAQVSASLTCTRPSLSVDYGLLGGDTAAQERFQALVTALRANYPTVLTATIEAGGAIVDLVGSFFDALDGFRDAIASMLDAVACVVKAMTISVQVTATFQASASACGGMTASVAVEGSASAGP